MSHTPDDKIEEAKHLEAATGHTMLDNGAVPGRSLTEQIVKRVDDIVWTDAEEAAVKSKIDWRMCPLLIITFALTYYDKTVISMAIIYTMKKDLNLQGNDYQNSSLIFYIGYLIGSFPLSYAAQRFHVGRSIAVMCLLWGITTMATIWCHDYTGLMIQRFFLGFIESGIAPTFIAVCGNWYTRREQVLRVAAFYSSTPYTALWGPPLTYALGLPTNGPFGTMTWKYMFLFAGLLTISWTFVIMFFFPTSPARARFLNERQRDIAIARLKVDNSGLINHTIKVGQIKECMLDWHFWALCAMGFCMSVTNGTTSSFSFIIIKGFGFNNLQSLLFKMPWGFLAGTNMVTGAWLAGRYPNLRFYVYMAGCVPVLIGSALLWQAPKQQDPRTYGLVGYYMLTTFGMAYAQVMAMAGANIAGYTKKVTASAGLFVSYSVANMVALVAYRAKEAPEYPSGFTCVIVCASTGLVTAIVTRLLLVRRNKASDLNSPIDGEHALEDVTDKQNPSFRYKL